MAAAGTPQDGGWDAREACPELLQFSHAHTYFPTTNSSTAPGTCVQRGQDCPVPLTLSHPSPGPGNGGHPTIPFGELWVHSQHRDVSQGAKAIIARVLSWQSRNLCSCWIINQGSLNSWVKQCPAAARGDCHCPVQQIIMCIQK